MIAMRVIIGLMIAFACFNACIGQLLDALSQVVSSLTDERADKFFLVLDSNLDGIVEKWEACVITDCVSENLHFDEETKRRFCDDDASKAWALLEFDKAEGGHGFHANMMRNIFVLGKSSPIFPIEARGAYALLYHALGCYTYNATITYEQFRSFHSCVQPDNAVTRPAFDKIDVNKDGGISEDEFCDAGVNFMIGGDRRGIGELFFGKYNY